MVDLSSLWLAYTWIIIMSVFSQSPTYNLKVALKKTGLKADVLRAWERRYDLPRPHRTPGGHRLYSENDIETVKWLRSRQSEGLTISRAVKLWNELLLEGQDPLAEGSTAFASPAPNQLPLPETRIDILRHTWVEAALAFNSAEAEDTVSQAFGIYPIERVCVEILQQGINEIGNAWYQGKATIQQEHFATAFASQRIETLISTSPTPTRTQTIVVGCPPGERHSFPALLLTLFLRRKGMDVIYLGADVPIIQMKETINAIQPKLIILAAQLLVTAASLQFSAIALQGQPIPLAYGGLIFNRVPRLRECIPAHFLGETLEESIQKIEWLVVTPVPYPTSGQVKLIHHKLVSIFQDKRPLIKYRLMEILPQGSLPAEYLDEANTYFGDGLAAALSLDDMDLFTPDLDWLVHLLAHRRYPSGSFVRYLTAYRQASAEVLGKDGAPITDWIGRYLAKILESL
jgi:DNA-binding transcriptional MerR regulator